MIAEKTVKTLEFDKILQAVASFAVLEKTKEAITRCSFETDLKEVNSLLDKTAEAYKLLYEHSVSGIFYFADVSEELDRADVGGTLNPAELLRIADNLKSARTIFGAIRSVTDESIVVLREISESLYLNEEFEKEIREKIISEDEISDTASPKLYSIRKSIKDINARIRNQLNSYMRTGFNKYLQESVVTMRQGRYVIPVKSEYRSQVKGFIHDQSSSGATVFIEPEVVMELNNDLKKAIFDEKEEIYKILKDLTVKVSFMTDAIRDNAEKLAVIDGFFARAEYSFKNKCVRPSVNKNGKTDVRSARHPLIAEDKVVPVTFRFGKDYNFLLITGPNTGGKTVTLKLVGILSLLTMCGIFIPAAADSEVSVYDGIYCDVGDEQSIENDLSTFSSHIKNIVGILNSLSGNCLVLLDELGAGTDPEEGCALALAVTETLLKANCYGIITSHYSKLKEFAVESEKIENASMEFDSETLKPLYRINIGIPGSSNAIEISKTLGLKESITNRATEYLSSDKINFEAVLRKAEASRKEASRLAEELEVLKAEKERELRDIVSEKEKIVKERERIYSNAKQEVKRIVSERMTEAEEIIEELKRILKAAGLESKEVFRASRLKNRLADGRYVSGEEENAPIELKKAEFSELKKGKRVYLKNLGAYGEIVSVKPEKKEAEILIGNIRSKVGFSDIYNAEDIKEKPSVKVNSSAVRKDVPKTELIVVGKTASEAIEETEAFIDGAVVNGLEEIRIVHGYGEGILRKKIREYLKKNKNVESFRNGVYGEGENGVTVVTLK
ncbi:MAG: endonuclease MutS2 [Clostridia bacterium]|nr:endonuclease MutS2 [Clostridia bacterium]